MRAFCEGWAKLNCGYGFARQYRLQVCFEATEYFRHVMRRPDRALIAEEWIVRAVVFPIREERQSDGRIRRWARIPEFENRALRVILLDDGVTGFL